MKKKTFSENTLIYEIQNLIHSLIQAENKIGIMFIPSHVNIEGNDQVITSQKPQVIFHASKFFTHKIWVLPWKRLDHLDRKNEIIIARLRLGHTRLSTHSYLFERPQPLICHLCHRGQFTVNHLLFLYPKLNDIRKLLKITKHQITRDQQNILNILTLLQRFGLFFKI